MNALNKFQDLTKKQLVNARSIVNTHNNVQSLKNEKYIAWCVALTQPLKELAPQQYLLDQGYEPSMPRFKKICHHARKVEQRLAPLFPRYIFVGIALSTTVWCGISGTRVVSQLLMIDDLNPAKVPTWIIDDLRAQEIGDGLVPVTSLANFGKSEKVRIVEGALADQVAIFESMDDKSRVQLLLTFMGRKMTFPTCAVKAA